MLSNVTVLPICKSIVGSKVIVKDPITGSTGAAGKGVPLEFEKTTRRKADGFRYRCCICRFIGSSRCERQRRRERDQGPTFPWHAPLVDT